MQTKVTNYDGRSFQATGDRFSSEDVRRLSHSAVESIEMTHVTYTNEVEVVRFPRAAYGFRFFDVHIPSSTKVVFCNPKNIAIINCDWASRTILETADSMDYLYISLNEEYVVDDLLRQVHSIGFLGLHGFGVTDKTCDLICEMHSVLFLELDCRRFDIREIRKIIQCEQLKSICLYGIDPKTATIIADDMDSNKVRLAPF